MNCLGHAHPKAVAALTEQAGKLWHLSNMFKVPKGVELAKKLGGAKGLQSDTTLHKPMRLSALRDALTYDD